MSLTRVFMILLAVVQGPIALAVPAQGHQIMMSGPSQYAVEAGRDIAAAGGNAIDVAVTMALTLSVTSPYFAALGGGGFAVIKAGDQPVTALDFRETAPGATSPSYYYKLSDMASRNGGTAVGVPGIPAGLFEMHKKFGKLPWDRLFARSLELARRGFRVTGEWVENTENHKKLFNESGRRRFLKKDGSVYLPGEELKQPDLYTALVRLRDHGAKGFYEGPVAEDIVQSVTATGGVIALKDLHDYKVRWLKPIETDFNGYHLYLMPPPSSGGVVIRTALTLIDRAKLIEKKFLSVEELHWLAEIDSRSFRGRVLLGDPEFHANPLEFLTTKSQLDFLFSSINKTKATTLPALSDSVTTPETTETTHMNVMDHDGNAVAMTITLNGDYGSGVVTDKYGIALNNEMDDFTTKPNTQNMFGLYQGVGNNVQPGKRPLSSMSPTLVEKNGQVVLALGAPGGPRIISGVLQVLYRILGQGMDIDRAVQAPRVHHQFLPDVLIVDKERLSPEILESLRKMGHKIEEKSVARVYVVKKTDKNILEGAFDSRGEGAAGGF